ncbi:MAG: hypothetical protein EPO26_04825 [Chloroflexota bacterium]|nr:MAG: hypothetical protein EPO26_04825 [Chloroflexota bacterium]
MGPLNRLFRSRHERLRDELGAYVDGHLTGSAREAIERHLAACASCRHKAEDLRVAIVALRRLPSVAAPRSFAVTAPIAAVQADFWSTFLPSLRLASASLAALAIVATAVNLAAPLPVRDMSLATRAGSFQPAPARPASIPREAAAAPAPLAVGAAAPVKPPTDSLPAVQAVAPKPASLGYAPRRPTPTAVGIVDRAGRTFSGALAGLPDARIPWPLVIAAAALATVGPIGLWFGRR